MKTLATVLALLLSVDAIKMPLKGSALAQTKWVTSCGGPGNPPCTGSAWDDMVQTKWQNCGGPGNPPCTGRAWDDMVQTKWQNCGGPGNPPCTGSAWDDMVQLKAAVNAKVDEKHSR